MKMIEKQGLMTYKLWNTLQKYKIVNPCSALILNILQRCGYTVADGRQAISLYTDCFTPFAMTYFMDKL